MRTRLSIASGSAIACAVIVILAACQLITPGAAAPSDIIDPPSGSTISLDPTFTIALGSLGNKDPFALFATIALRKRSDGTTVPGPSGGSIEIGRDFSAFGDVIHAEVVYRNVTFKNLDPGAWYDLEWSGARHASYLTTGSGGGTDTTTATVTGISPATAARGAKIQANVSGTGFAPGAQVRLTGGATTIDATGETTISASRIRCTLEIPSGAYVGSYAVSVQNPGTTAPASREAAFTVPGTASAPATSAPMVTGISPASGNPGQTIAVTVSGTGFGDGVAVWFLSGDQWMNVRGETVNAGGTRITGNMSIPADAPLGTYAVYLFTPGQPVGYRADAFEVEDGETVITAVSPTEGSPGQNVSLTISGTGFGTGVQAWFFNGERWMNVMGEAVNSEGTSITGTMAVPVDAPPGNYSVYLFTSGRAPVYRQDAFEVEQGDTVINTVSPTSGNCGQTVSVTISGSGFEDGVQVWFFNGNRWLNVRDEAINSAGTSISGPMTIPATAPPGTYTVYLFTPGQPVVSKQNVLTVTGSTSTPDVTGFQPATVYRGSTVTANVYGRNFQPGAQIKIQHTAFPNPLASWTQATGETVLSPTQIRCTISVPLNARGGTYGVLVANPGAPNTWYGLGTAFTLV